MQLTDTVAAAERIGREEAERAISVRFATWVRATPEAIAVVDDAGRLSYAELDARADRLAAALRARGIGPQATVGVAFERSRDLPVALLAILKIGAAYVPLDTAYPAERLAFLIADAGLSAVVTQRPICDPALYAGLAVVSVVDDAAEIAAYAARACDVAVSPAWPAYVMYTSGSTGRPKGVAISHRNVTRLVVDADYCAMTPERTFMHFAPLAFDASTFEIWAPLLNGATLAIPRPGPFTVAELGDAIARFGVTTMWLTTALFGRVVDAAPPTFANLRHVLTGGDVASPRHVRAFRAAYPACRLTNGYGPTENTTFSACCDLTAHDDFGDDVPIGRPIARSTAYVLDDALQPVPHGAVGELCVGGEGVGIGYLNLPELTAARFVPDPFAGRAGARMYRTGDRARIRADGSIAFLGRTDDQVKVRGFRVELGEIDAALRALDGVVDAAAVAVDDGTGNGLTLVAFVVPAATHALEGPTVRARLAERLPAFVVPHRIEIVAALPEHASAKVDRAALRAVAAALVARPGTPAAGASVVRATPRTRAEMERTVARCWFEVLGEHVDRDVNFFDAGGDSLRLLSLHAALGRAFGRDLATVDLFEHVTIAQHVALLAGR